MTWNEAPAPGAPAGRRRALGRGPGAGPAEPAAAPAGPAEAKPPETGPAVPEPAAPEPGPAASEPAASEPAVPEPAVPEPGPGGAVPESGPAVPEPAVPEPEPAVPEPGPAESASEPASPEPGPAESASEPAAPEPGPAVPEPAAPEPGPAESASEPAVPEPGPGGAEPEPGPAASEPAASEPGPGGAEPESASGGVFKVRLSNFEGPFDLLLQLISRHKLDVTEVALSKVTDEFMAHIRAMGPDWDLDQTTEFLVVAATLLDLKAARLLPAAEVEDEADLALLEARDLLFARLLQYRAYKRIADIFNERLDEEARRHPRTVGLEPGHAELLPEVVIGIGPEGFAKLAVKAMRPKPAPQVYVDHIHAPLVSVREQARLVVARLKELGEASFRALVEDTEDTLTVVARFLALLELYREKAVALDQETALGELLVRWTGGDGDGTPMVTDEFDRPPGRPERPEEERKA
ncbi:segregation/condensation protein A [Streptomyces achromogenes]|uniref:segregation/condensation protein A n=1 Tax=Streptomyces achromogenes TaxID=67255 RepID=UPI003679C689